MLRSPDDPKFRLRSRVPAETHRRRPEVTMKDAYSIRHRGRVFPGRWADQAGDPRHAQDFPERRQGGHQRTSDGRIPAIAVRGRDLPHRDIRTAHTELRHLRQTVAKIAAEHGLAILAAGTHPTADWGRSQQSEGGRYDAVMDDLQMIGRRNMLCGLHVHVELPDPDDRVDVMTRMLPYLPLFIALATSSPFWRSRPTGLKGYRLAAYDELPRTGVPELLRTKRNSTPMWTRWWGRRDAGCELHLVVDAPLAEASDPGIARAGCPTLVDDSIAIAALWRSLARRLVRNPALNRDITAVTRAIVVENKWRAQRYGVHGSFVGRPRRHHGCRFRRSGGRGNLRRRRGARLPRRNAALPHHRRLRHLGRRPDGGVREIRQDRGRARALTAVTDWLAATTLQ